MFSFVHPANNPSINISSKLYHFSLVEFFLYNHRKYKIITDRGQAIKHAILEAKPNSVILITGKGNETVQYVKGKYVECETDVQYAKKYLNELDKKEEIKKQ